MQIDVGKLMGDIIDSLKLRYDLCTGDFSRAYTHSCYMFTELFCEFFEMEGTDAPPLLLSWIEKLSPDMEQWRDSDLVAASGKFFSWCIDTAQEDWSDETMAFMDCAALLTASATGTHTSVDDPRLVEYRRKMQAS